MTSLSLGEGVKDFVTIVLKALVIKSVTKGGRGSKNDQITWRHSWTTSKQNMLAENDSLLHKKVWRHFLATPAYGILIENSSCLAIKFPFLRKRWKPIRLMNNIILVNKMLFWESKSNQNGRCWCFYRLFKYRKKLLVTNNLSSFGTISLWRNLRGKIHKLLHKQDLRIKLTSKAVFISTNNLWIKEITLDSFTFGLVLLMQNADQKTSNLWRALLWQLSRRRIDRSQLNIIFRQITFKRKKVLIEQQCWMFCFRCSVVSSGVSNSNPH